MLKPHLNSLENLTAPLIGAIRVFVHSRQHRRRCLLCCDKPGGGILF